MGLAIDEPTVGKSWLARTGADPAAPLGDCDALVADDIVRRDAASGRTEHVQTRFAAVSSRRS